MRQLKYINKKARNKYNFDIHLSRKVLKLARIVVAFSVKTRRFKYQQLELVYPRSKIISATFFKTSNVTTRISVSVVSLNKHHN